MPTNNNIVIYHRKFSRLFRLNSALFPYQLKISQGAFENFSSNEVTEITRKAKKYFVKMLIQRRVSNYLSHIFEFIINFNQRRPNHYTKVLCYSLNFHHKPLNPFPFLTKTDILSSSKSSQP